MSRICQNKACRLCNTSNFKTLLYFDKAIFSDGFFIDKPMLKEECTNCGTIRTKLKINLDEFYKINYKPSRETDTIAITDDEEINRSSFIYNWIMDLMENSKLNDRENMLEIGCGQGYLLNRFKIKNKFGIEPNTKASKIANKIAKVQNIGFEDIDDTNFDFVLSYCVIEHLEDPNKFLEKTHQILNKNGAMCVALPIQDKFNYDLFFADHLHHFSHKNFITLLLNHGFKILSYELGRESYSNIGIYICKKQDKQKMDYSYIHNDNIQNVNSILDNINKIIKEYKNKNLYAFGYGEIAKTIIPYTNLDNYIISYIDDYSKADKVVSSSEAKNIFKETKDINIILLVNPIHIEKIKSLFLDNKNINFINIFDTIKLVQ